jgi:hypothetical protein
MMIPAADIRCRNEKNCIENDLMVLIFPSDFVLVVPPPPPPPRILTRQRKVEQRLGGAPRRDNNVRYALFTMLCIL